MNANIFALIWNFEKNATYQCASKIPEIKRQDPICHFSKQIYMEKKDNRMLKKINYFSLAIPPIGTQN